MRHLLASLLILVAGLLPGTALADPYVGSFVGELDGKQYQLSIDWVSASTYDGILQVDGMPMQFDARRYGERMGGRIADESQQFRFRARIEGSLLILEIEDGRRLVLRRG